LSTPTDCDIAVVGAGMVGATLACALAVDGWRVTLVESSELAWPPPEFDPDAGPDLRVSAISVASERIFRNLGMWDLLEGWRISPYWRMEVWEGGARIGFDSAELPWPHLGHIIENRLIRDAALHCLHRAGGERVRTVTGTGVSDMRSDGAQAARLRLEDGREVSARLVVAADGAGSPLRGIAGLRAWQRWYDQQAVVAVVACEHAHQATARQRFLRGGPLALLPLADGRCSIVWSTAAEHADELVAMAPEAFSDAVSEASEHVLGRLELDGERRSFPLRFLQAGRYRAPRLALVGDAAHVVHPLAGQGVNLGLLDAAALAGVLGTAGASRTDPGSARLLGRYERWRKGHNLLVGGVMHGFKHLFGNASPVLILARDSGLSLVDRSGPVKRAIMRQAMGLEGDLPPLARIAPA